ncbi:MAG: hypothetical protein ACQES2_02665 [Pseudomonadota bacterium]
MKKQITQWLLILGGVLFSLGSLQASDLDMSDFNPNTMGLVPANSRAIDSVQILVVEERPGEGFVRFKSCEECEYRGMNYDRSTEVEDAAGNQVSTEKLKSYSGEKAMLGFTEGEKLLRQIKLSERDSGGES